MIYSLNIVIFHGYVRHVPSFSVVKWPVFSSEITLILIPCERVSYCEISLWMSAIIGNPKIGCCIQYQGNIGIILDTSWILHRIYDTLECIWVRYCRYMENKLKTPQWQFFFLGKSWDVDIFRCYSMFMFTQDISSYSLSPGRSRTAALFWAVASAPAGGLQIPMKASQKEPPRIFHHDLRNCHMIDTEYETLIISYLSKLM